MSEITVRECKQDDLPRLIEIWKEQVDIVLQMDSRLEYDGGFIGDVDMLETAIGGAMLHNQGNFHILGAVHVDRIVGFVCLVLSGREKFTPTQASLQALAIDSHDGQGGVGTALLDRCMEILREHGITALTVTAPKHHAVQQAFWRAKGGRVIQETFYLPVKPADDESEEQ